MKFYFYDKTEREKDVILDILSAENIRAKVSRDVIKHIFYNDIEEEDIIMVEEKFTICIDTSLEYFDFIKMLVKKKINTLIDLERSYLLDSGKKKRKRKSETII